MSSLYEGFLFWGLLWLSFFSVGGYGNFFLMFFTFTSVILFCDARIQMRSFRMMLSLKATDVKTRNAMVFCFLTQVNFQQWPACLTYLKDNLFHLSLTHWISCCVFLAEEKVLTCQQCGLARDEEEAKKMSSEIARLLDKASTVFSAGNILFDELLIVL